MLLTCNLAVLQAINLTVYNGRQSSQEGSGNKFRVSLVLMLSYACGGTDGSSSTNAVMQAALLADTATPARLRRQSSEMTSRLGHLTTTVVVLDCSVEASHVKHEK